MSDRRVLTGMMFEREILRQQGVATAGVGAPGCMAGQGAERGSCESRLKMDAEMVLFETM